jgi:hypothetical protein
MAIMAIPRNQSIQTNSLSATALRELYEMVGLFLDFCKIGKLSAFGKSVNLKSSFASWQKQGSYRYRVF